MLVGLWRQNYGKRMSAILHDDVTTRAMRVRMVVMDVDGTLTDGAMYYGVDGEALKRFSTRDGMGVTLLHKAGLRTAIITSEQTDIVVRRAEKLRIDEVLLGIHDKTAALHDLSRRTSVPLDHIAYIGDDVNDLHVMRLCGLSACPNDAVAAIRDVAHYRCMANGGHGAVREFVELILTAQDLPITLPERW
jgi:3-deoxy-D-manno-octulosonate 8-phosphate phosphatase (KDO 8-P phosphatase)